MEYARHMTNRSLDQINDLIDQGDNSPELLADLLALADDEYRIEVTHKGDTGFLVTTVTADMKARYAVTLDAQTADTYTTRARADRAAARIADRFEQIEVVPA